MVSGASFSSVIVFCLLPSQPVTNTVVLAACSITCAIACFIASASASSFFFASYSFKYLLALFWAELSPDLARNRKYFVVRQAFASFQHSFLRSAENVDLHNLIGGVLENIILDNIANVLYVFLWFWVVQWCDVDHCSFRQMLYPFLWQMLLLIFSWSFFPPVADGKPLRPILSLNTK